MAGAPFPVPSPGDLADAFRWAEWRTVTKTGLVSLHGNRYQVDPALAGPQGRAGLRPVRPVVPAGPPRGQGRRARPSRSRSAGTPTPRPGPRSRPSRPSPPTGIDYLALVDARHTADLAGKVNYAALAEPEEPVTPAAPAPAEVSALIAWMRRLSDAGIRRDPAELAAFQDAKKDLLARIQASRATTKQPGDPR